MKLRVGLKLGGTDHSLLSRCLLQADSTMYLPPGSPAEGSVTQACQLHMSEVTTGSKHYSFGLTLQADRVAQGKESNPCYSLPLSHSSDLTSS